ncbi:hypothetical protein SCA6_001265 [Theobroma cacao]
MTTGNQQQNKIKINGAFDMDVNLTSLQFSSPMSIHCFESSCSATMQVVPCPLRSTRQQPWIFLGKRLLLCLRLSLVYRFRLHGSIFF